MNQLTTIAALPGSGAGCMSALPAEKNEHAEPIKWPAAQCQYDPITRAFARIQGRYTPSEGCKTLVWPPITFGGPGC